MIINIFEQSNNLCLIYQALRGINILIFPIYNYLNKCQIQHIGLQKCITEPHYKIQNSILYPLIDENYEEQSSPPHFHEQTIYVIFSDLQIDSLTATHVLFFLALTVDILYFLIRIIISTHSKALFVSCIIFQSSSQGLMGTYFAQLTRFKNF